MSSETVVYISNALSDTAGVSLPVAPVPASVQPNKDRSAELNTFWNIDDKCSDDELLSQISDGNRIALSILFRRHARRILHVAQRILRDASEAEDLRQEVFLLVFQKAKSFDPTKGTASSWIVQIAYSRALNRKQYLTTRQHYTVQELNEEQLVDVRQLPLVDDVLAKSLLKQLREQLSEEQRSTLELHFFEGYSLREIAEKTNQTLGNVRHHYYRGLERLRANVFPKKDS